MFLISLHNTFELYVLFHYRLQLCLGECGNAIKGDDIFDEFCSGWYCSINDLHKCLGGCNRIISHHRQLCDKFSCPVRDDY